MKVIEHWRDLVHTHFVTDGLRLTTERVREIERGFVPVLRASGIVVGIHFAEPRRPGGIRIVLECQPRGAELERLERELGRIIAPIPVRPPTVTSIHDEGSSPGSGPGGGRH